MQKYQAFLAKYDGVQDLTAEQQQDLISVAQSLPNVDKENLALASQSLAAKEVIDQTIESAKAEQETTKMEASVLFK